MIVHELVHLRHRDALSAYLLQILCKGAFFSPCSRLLQQRYLLEKEQRCDQEAAALLGDRRSYAAACSEFGNCCWKSILEIWPRPAASRATKGGRRWS